MTLRGHENNAFALGQQDHNYQVNDDWLLRFDGNGCLIFISSDCMDVLHESEYWICDGTFEMCPRGFKQIYTIHGFVNGEGNQTSICYIT